MKWSALIYLVSLALLAGCADTSALVRPVSSSGFEKVFDVRGGEARLKTGEAGLDVAAMLKTHKARPSLFPDRHGTPEFRLQVSIDGQADAWPGALHEERGRFLNLADPEAGAGVRYRFFKPLRLKAGTHQMVVALPDEGVSVKRSITLEEGRLHTLVVEPVYSAKAEKRRPGLFGSATFKEGVRSFRLILDGKQLES
ncbi:hypothetical protein [Geomonas propionica]|uniref:Lipoprotein n=1 Tax=Geomonas propionica TaxID=2798582 RepID=A0ABS0YRD8_9BACT|nr:hypothetical protein [Geomonas propionica]MBJ6800077.1 hypothetical protein [Geomonas propionica]